MVDRADSFALGKYTGPSWEDLLKDEKTTTKELAAYILRHLQGYRQNTSVFKMMDDRNDMEVYLITFAKAAVKQGLIEVYELKTDYEKTQIEKGFLTAANERNKTNE